MSINTRTLRLAVVEGLPKPMTVPLRDLSRKHERPFELPRDRRYETQSWECSDHAACMWECSFVVKAITVGVVTIVN